MSATHIQARFQRDFSGFALDVDVQLPARGVTVLFGPSGSGKTTLLRCVAGLEQAQQGFLSVGEVVWQDSQQGLFVPTYRRPLGYVFQEANLFPHLSVRQNLDYGRKRCRTACAAKVLHQAIELLGIGHLLERKPTHLSGGERQRVAIARALAVCPQVLLMDEPLAALDQQRKQEVLPFLTQLPKELDLPILYVTHSPQELTQLADYLLLLEAGKVCAQGTLEQVLSRLDSPLAHSQQASTVISGTLEAYEPEFQLAHVSFPGGVFYLPLREPLALGRALRLRIYARDVILALQPPSASSVLNVLAARISELSQGTDGRTLVRLEVGTTVLLASVAAKSAALLKLQVGLAVFAQVKATAIV